MSKLKSGQPLDSESVNLLVKGDLLQWRGTAISLVSFHHANVMGVQVIDIRDGRRWTASPTALSFIGRPAADGWMPWDGAAACPVPLEQMVEYRTRSGDTYTDPAGALFWPHTVEGHDIIAFRLAPTAPVEASGSERSMSVERIKGWLERNPQGGAEPIHPDDLRALLTTPARAEAQDEGAAGRIERWIANGMPDTSDHTPHSARLKQDLQAIIAAARPHPSPPPAADDDRVLQGLADRVTAEVKRGADGSFVQALGALSNIEAMVLEAVLKSTAAKEGEKS